ncbi:hypothetical protein [Winogradskyella vincentii]|uniref:Uncharacterized protein n=1 Tax=Winogradskyella vincentii TaxID=2877122 RepID=A0ABS7XYA4_9FLAO|nr:hypothetical protein [Winogradskyella vincentii]MCA0152635.1 hypothetical protein [Winogradskyella vincentii]
MANNINTIVVVTDFVINQDLIAKTLCIQKEEQKGCNGKCQLNKQLKEANNQGENQPLQIKNRIELSYFILTKKESSIISKNYFIDYTKNKFIHHQDVIPLEIIRKILHPPKAFA